LAGEPPEDKSKYNLPPGFRKALERFNIDRAIQEPAETPLVRRPRASGRALRPDHDLRQRDRTSIAVQFTQ